LISPTPYRSEFSWWMLIVVVLFTLMLGDLLGLPVPW
jgi:hypothetical protein